MKDGPKPVMGGRFLKLLALCCGLAVAAAPGAAAAQAAAKPAAKAAEPLGRLFFTPAQRLSLDVTRTQRARTALSTERTEEAAPVVQTLTYGGMVRRSDGKNTVWINNRPINDQELAGGANIVGRVRPDGGVTLRVPRSGRSVNLKPGQSVELLSGTIEESYSRKPVQPEPKTAAKPVTDAMPAAKPTSAERAADERNREEREQQRVEDAVSRALQGAAGAKPEAAPAQTPKGPAP